jgi:hypothetical protein
VALVTGKLLDEIPPGQYVYNDYPCFVNWPYRSQEAKWHVFGPIDKVLLNTVVEVHRYSGPSMNAGDTRDPAHVQILEYVAERVVRRRSGERVRFVMATFDNVVVEVNDGISQG